MRIQPRQSRPSRLAGVALLLLLAACGGGGGGGPPPIPPPPGVTGLAVHADLDLGRLNEQEPNDAAPQVFRLPAAGPRTRLEVGGAVGVDARWRGRLDLVDVIAYEVVTAQDVAASLRWTATDPVDGGPNDLALEVVDAATGAVLGASDGGPQPRRVDVSLEAWQTVHVAIRAEAGHGAYVLELVASDPLLPGPPVKPEGIRRMPSPAPARPPAPPTGPCAATHVLARLAPGADVERVAARCGLVPGDRTASGTWRLRLGPAARADAMVAAAAACARLAGDPEVVWTEPDWVVRSFAATNDAELCRQWPLAAIGVDGAWDVTRGEASVVVGIVDTGFVDHPDLQGQTVPGYDFISDPERAGDGDGRDGDPTDTGDQALEAGMSAWHGSHVGAIVAARADDGYGIAGVAPGCRVMPLRAVGIGGGLASDTADAIRYAAGLYDPPGPTPALAEPVDVLNLSFGVSVDATEIRLACRDASDAGVFIVGAAGNSLGPVEYPAALPTVFAVAAVDGSLDLTGYSNFGTEIEIAAPGGRSSGDAWGDGWPDGILSVGLDETVFPPEPMHQHLVGTSQAAPHVAGAAALLLSIAPDLQPHEIGSLLRRSARDIGSLGRDDFFGWGLLQVHGAVRLLLEEQGMPRLDPTRLGLGTQSVLFSNLEVEQYVPLQNLGGGTLGILAAEAVTDDGVPWLTTLLVPSSTGIAITASAVRFRIEYDRLPREPGRYGATVRIFDVTGVIGSVRVVLLIGDFLRVGRRVGIAMEEVDTGIARVFGVARPATGYRYWLREVPEGIYTLVAGEDLDRDGFFCEVADACGYYGGPTREEATPLEFEAGETLFDTDVLLRAP